MKIAIFLAPGFEEIEALTVADILRRAQLDVQLVAVNGNQLAVNGTHNILVTADCTVADLNPDDIDVTVFPGGLPGATNLAADKPTLDIVRKVVAKGGFATAICAAPVALHAAGVLNEKAYTCYPSFETQIGGNYTAKPVQVDGKIITGRGPGASAQFAFEILNQIGLQDKAEQLRKGMLYD